MISPTDLGIKAAREALKRAGIAPTDIDSVITGNMAPGDFDQFFLPRHIGLYAGVPQEVPAIMTQRICGTGFELFRQAGEQIEAGVCDAALVVGITPTAITPLMTLTEEGTLVPPNPLATLVTPVTPATGFKEELQRV